MEKNLDARQRGFQLDEYGRVMIEDDAILEQIKGGFDFSGEFEETLSNGACVNASCS